MVKAKGKANNSRKDEIRSVGVVTRSKANLVQRGGGDYLQLRSRRLERKAVVLIKKQKKHDVLGENEQGHKDVLVGEEANIPTQAVELTVKNKESRSTAGSLVLLSENIRTPTSSNRPVTGQIMPTAQELEDFFGESERRQIRGFIEKYNFDAVNDKPLKGRFQWKKLKP